MSFIGAIGREIMAHGSMKKSRQYDRNTARMKANMPYHKAGVASLNAPSSRYGSNPLPKAAEPKPRLKKPPKLTKPISRRI